MASVEPLAASDGKTRISLNSELSAVDPVALIVDIRHGGFTSFSRRVDVKPSIYLDASLAPLTPSVVTASEHVSISGATTNGFTVQVNDPLESNPAMSISIPASSLPAGTDSLTAAIKTFDPNNTEDAQYFPGSYADSSGNGLVSVAFNYAEIKTGSGEPLQTVAKNALLARQATGAIGFASPAEPVIINRTIPSNSCSILEKLGDANAELSGFQIPVYTYNPRSGLWDLLGSGTVYSATGVAIDGNTTDLDCVGTSYVLEIKVSNEIFLSDWWNLDYPLQFNEPIKRCTNLHIVNEKNEPLAGVHGLITGDGNFSSQHFVTDINGDANVSVDVVSDSVTSGEFIVWGASGATGSVNLSASCPTAERQTLIIKRPQLCQIKGQVTLINGNPITHTGIFAVNELGNINDYYYSWASTNAAGIYTLDVACNTPYSVQVWFSPEGTYGSTVVNGTVDAKELTDDGTVLTLPMTVFENPPISTNIYNIGYEQSSQEAVVIFYGMYDAFPINYDLKLRNKNTGEVWAFAQGRLEFDNLLLEGEFTQWFLRFGQIRVPLVLPADFTGYAVQGTYIDGFGETTSLDLPLQTLAQDIIQDQ